MRHRTGLLLTASILSILLLSSVSASAANFTVTTMADTADGVCDADCSLREAVIAANALPGSDTIDVPAGTYPLTRAGACEDAAMTGDLDITGSVQIHGRGMGAIIDGGGLDRIFQVLGGSLMLSGIALQNEGVVGCVGSGVPTEPVPDSGTPAVQENPTTGEPSEGSPSGTGGTGPEVTPGEVRGSGSGGSPPCVSLCGNGVLDVEECDDGNQDNTDDCLNSCRRPYCGDGFVQAGVEQCDDGNNVGGDGCSANCLLEMSHKTLLAPWYQRFYDSWVR
jgi:CSLREA domain-containing protein